MTPMLIHKDEDMELSIENIPRRHFWDSSWDSLKRNRQEDCQYVHDEGLYISSWQPLISSTPPIRVKINKNKIDVWKGHIVSYLIMNMNKHPISFA